MHLSIQCHQLSSNHPQVHQRVQGVQLGRVLRESPVAHLRVPELSLDHAECVLDEAIDADSGAIEEEMDEAQGAPAAGDKRPVKRQALPANLPRREVRHEPANTDCHCGCAMKRIGEDVAEKFD